MGGASLPGDNAWESGAAGGGPIHSSAFPAVVWAFLSLTALRNCGSCGFHRIHLTQIVEMWRCFLVSDLNVPRSRHPALPPPPRAGLTFRTPVALGSLAPTGFLEAPAV